MLTVEEVCLNNKRVLIREDFNVPMKDGKITHTARIDAALPGLHYILKNGAKVFLMSHLGRPQEGQFEKAYSLQPIADYLSTRLQQAVPLFSLDEVPLLKKGEVALLENVRFLPGESTNDPHLSQQLAALCDVFIMDAFAAAHRAHASTVGVVHFAKEACAGPLLQKEVGVLHQILQAPQRPVLAIVGGSKVSTKLAILTHLLEKVDVLALGGGIANTFLAARGNEIGDSLCETDLIETANALEQKAKAQGKTIWVASDVVVAPTLESPKGVIKSAQAVKKGEKILDIGPQSRQELIQYIQQAKTILWNGPLGVFEMPPFAHGTFAIANAIAASSAYSVAGGGDTLSAIAGAKIEEGISYLSTGGGAFLESLEGKILPAIAALEAR